jgi:hypothetical protein
MITLGIQRKYWTNSISFAHFSEGNKVVKTQQKENET